MKNCKIVIHNKTAEIWTTLGSREEPFTEQVRQLLERGYSVVIYRSGNADLQEMTSQLLLANR